MTSQAGIISARTKAVLAAAKRRGVKLGRDPWGSIDGQGTTNISTNSFWPVTSQKVRWRGIDIWIMPIMKGYYPAVAVMVPPGKSRAECEELVMRFLSMLSWVEGRGFMVDGLGGGNLPRPMG